MGISLALAIVVAIVATIVIATYTLYDFLYLEIPDEVLIPGIGLIFFILLISSYIPGIDWIYHLSMSYPYDIPLTNGVLGALVMYSFFMIQIVLSGGRWMGGGDLRLALFLGILFGFKYMLVGLFFAYIIGSIVGIMLMIFSKKGLKTQVPFGPFLTGGYIMALLIAPYYLSLFLPS